jgi:repressor LexA
MGPPVGMTPFPTSAQVRTKLAQLAEADEISLSNLSKLMGRYPAYLNRFVKLGRPESLAPADREWLARWFNIDPFELGDKSRPD